MTGPDMAYTTGDIRTGAGRAVDAAGVADGVRSLLGGTAVNASAFGDVAAAARFATGLDSSRDGFARTGHAVHAAHTRLDANARTIAADGDQLVPETSAIAGSGGAAPPAPGGGSISDGMLG